MPFEPVIPKGAQLGASHKVPGAVSGNAYTASGKNLGPVAWRSVEALTDEAPPSISSLVPLALVAIAGVAIGVAGTKAAQQLKTQREDLSSKRHMSTELPAGWYVQASDASLLRYWDGRAWTTYVASRARAAVAAADWYPDPADATQLRYWNGDAWTSHVWSRHAAVAASADWYVDPSDARQWRYWDGRAWTNHVAPIGATTAVSVITTATGSIAARGPSVPRDARISMSSAEWQEHVRAWLAAGAIEQELWTRLSNAQLKDADHATLEAQREMGQLTPQEGAHRIKLMLEANPSMRDDFGLAEFVKSFGRGQRGPLEDAVPLTIERAESRHALGRFRRHRR